jgi:protein-disulfide isomerase
MTDGSSQVPATCPFCGAQLAAFAGFCVACGRALNSASEPTAAVADQTTFAPAIDASQPPAYGQSPGYGQPWGGQPTPGLGQPPDYSQIPGYAWQPAFQTNYGYAPVPIRRNIAAIALVLLAAGLILILAAGAMVVVAGGSRSAGAGATPAVNRLEAGQSVLPGDIVAPSLATPADIPTNGRTLGPSSAPVAVEVWADYQCPPCLDFNTDVMPQLIDSYVRSGKVKVIVRDYVVIDSSMGGTESADAANAASCAADQGKFWTFQDWLFANQGQEAGGSYSTGRLLEMGRRAGLDETAFQGCVAGNAHASDVEAESAAAESAGVHETPAVAVNGKLLDSADYVAVAAAIDAVL